MKRLLFFSVIASLALFSACEELGDLLPDAEQVISETYNFTITENVAEGVTTATAVDITEYEQYKANTEYIEDYIITKLTYEISNYSAPEDLFISGELNVFKEDSTDVQTLGTISSVNLADMAVLAEEQEVAVDTTVAEQMVMWMNELETFGVQFEYVFQDSTGADYQFIEEDFGTGFDMTANVYVTMITGGLDDNFEITLD